VGLAAVQLAKTVPNVTIYGTASQSKHEFLKSCGVDHLIDYTTQDYAAEILRLTNGLGVHMILDALGSSDNQKGYSILRRMGHLIIYGASNFFDGTTRNIINLLKQLWHMPKFAPMDLMDKNRTVSGVNMNRFIKTTEERDVLLGEMIHIMQLYDEGKVKPVVDSIFPFSKARDAHTRLHSRKNVGKVVLVPDLLYKRKEADKEAETK